LADLLVVGGASRVNKPLLGGTRERLLRKALVPVMVAKAPLRVEAKTFFVPTDFSSCAREAAEETLMLAKSFSAQVIFFHILDLHPSYLNIYYDAVIACIRDAEAILIFGPGEAKGELKKRLERHKLDGRIVAIETVDKMTDRQIAAKVRLRPPLCGLPTPSAN
jgi:nucleotide-binding universal stress UspA family protein